MQGQLKKAQNERDLNKNVNDLAELRAISPFRDFTLFINLSGSFTIFSHMAFPYLIVVRLFFVNLVALITNHFQIGSFSFPPNGGVGAETRTRFGKGCNNTNDV
jgi:hypothetical protein